MRARSVGESRVDDDSRLLRALVIGSERTPQRGSGRGTAKRTNRGIYRTAMENGTER